MTPPIDRRTFVKLAGLSGLGAVAGASGCDPDDLDPAVGVPRTEPPTEGWSGVAAVDTEAFPAGVQAGDPTADGLVVWAYAATARSLTLHVALWDRTELGWRAQQDLPITVTDRGVVHVDLTGLPADTWIAYQFTDGDGRGSAIGQAVTCQPDDVDGVVRLAATSCLEQGHEAFPSLTHAVARGPLDAWLWLGDTIYVDKRVAGKDTATTYPEIAETWRDQFARDGFPAVHHAVAGVHTIDDHEVANDFDPTTLDPQRLAEAMAAVFDYTPTRRSEGGRLWRRLRFGRTVELFVLDCRTERIPAGFAQYLSPEQEQWLVEGVQRSDATWKVIANSVPFTRVDNETWNLVKKPRDSWVGFAAQRARVLAALAEVPGVIFVSGDVHASAVSRIEPEGEAGFAVFDVWNGPGGSLRNGGILALEGDLQFPYGSLEWQATRFDFRPDGTCDVAFVGEDDETYFTCTLTTDGELIEAS